MQAPDWQPGKLLELSGGYWQTCVLHAAVKLDIFSVIGGGPGTYAIHFCLRNPELSATVFDLPSTRPFAEKTISRFELSERIRFQEGDYLADAFEGGYDVAWLSQVLHAEGFRDCAAILRKAVDALNPGGLIAIHEFILNDSMDGPLFPTLFSLNMLLGTPAGQSYSEKQLVAMLTEAGADGIRRVPVESPNDSGLLIGFRAS